jgi:hypothetical protein
LRGALLAAAVALLAPALVRGDPDVLRAVKDSASFETRVRTLCDELGPRLAGTPGMGRAADWALSQFQAAGVDGAWLEPFEIPRSWSDEGAKIRITEPVEFELKAVSTVWSPSTPPERADLELIRSDGLGEGSVSRLGSKARGRAVLVLLDEAKTFYAVGVQEGNAIRAMREAGEAGAAAVLFASTKPDRVLFRHVHSLDARMDPVPSAVLGREDALRVGRLIASGQTVKASVSISTKQGGPVRGINVVGEIRGSEIPGEVVILGAHLDSWDLGTGCLDNGVNAAGVIESAQAIVASGKRPRRTIRFVLFDGEEYGLFGSRAYVQRHRDELDSVAAVIVHDMGQDRIQGYALGGRPDLEPGLREAMSRIDDARGMRHTRDAFIGSDHFDFQLEGVPALVAIQDTGSYVLPYHSEVDTFDKVDMDQVRARASIAAATVFGLANADQRIGPRLDRAGVEAVLRRSGLAEQMKFLELWDDWESGKRGRQANPATP